MMRIGSDYVLADSIDDVLNKQDTYAMTMLLLIASSDNPRYSTLNELPFIIDDIDQLKKFLKYYEGQTIEIPPLKDITDSLRILALFQYYIIEKQEWHEALASAGFNEEDTYMAKIKLNAFKNQLEKFDYKLGGLLK